MDLENVITLSETGLDISIEIKLDSQLSFCIGGPVEEFASKLLVDLAGLSSMQVEREREFLEIFIWESFKDRPWQSYPVTFMNGYIQQTCLVLKMAFTGVVHKAVPVCFQVRQEVCLPIEVCERADARSLLLALEDAGLAQADHPLSAFYFSENTFAEGSFLKCRSCCSRIVDSVRNSVIDSPLLPSFSAGGLGEGAPAIWGEAGAPNFIFEVDPGSSLQINDESVQEAIREFGLLDSGALISARHLVHFHYIRNGGRTSAPACKNEENLWV